jgi:hypothetical protein
MMRSAEWTCACENYNVGDAPCPRCKEPRPTPEQDAEMEAVVHTLYMAFGMRDSLEPEKKFGSYPISLRAAWTMYLVARDPLVKQIAELEEQLRKT